MSIILLLAKIKLLKDILEGNDSMRILFDYVGLCLFDIITDTPNMHSLPVPYYQPHLIIINQIISTYGQKISRKSLYQLKNFQKKQRRAFYTHSLYIIAIMDDHTPSLGTLQTIPFLQYKTISKEQFFVTKKNNKRMKSSVCFSDIAQSSHPVQETPLDFSLNSLVDRPSFKFQAKQLDSTFGEEAQFSFKRQQPKRKINVRNISSQNNSAILHLRRSPSTKKLLFRNNSPGGRNRQLDRNNLNKLPVKELRRKWGLSDFVLLGKMGEGSYSEVFRAIEKQTGWVYALKVLSKQQIKQLEQQNNVIRQIKINLFCQHPNIAKLYGFFCDQKHIYLVCQYACHRNLFQALYQPRLKLRKGLMSGVASDYTRQICSAVSYLHQNNLMHRDIKPQNILLSYGTIKLCDFGWAVHNSMRQLRSTLCGTPLYLAPELISQQDYSQAVDIWAVGIITYEMLTEEIPFTISKPSELYKIVSEQIKLQRVRNSKAADFIAKALQKDPKKRVNIEKLCTHSFVQE